MLCIHSLRAMDFMKPPIESTSYSITSYYSLCILLCQSIWLMPAVCSIRHSPKFGKLKTAILNTNQISNFPFILFYCINLSQLILERQEKMEKYNQHQNEDEHECVNKRSHHLDVMYIFRR